VSKLVTLLFRDPATGLHRVAGTYTQKQHAWDAMQKLYDGKLEELMIHYAPEKADRPCTLRNLSECLRYKLGSLIVVGPENKTMMLVQVEGNAFYGLDTRIDPEDGQALCFPINRASLAVIAAATTLLNEGKWDMDLDGVEIDEEGNHDVLFASDDGGGEEQVTRVFLDTLIEKLQELKEDDDEEE